MNEYLENLALEHDFLFVDWDIGQGVDLGFECEHVGLSVQIYVIQGHFVPLHVY